MTCGYCDHPLTAILDMGEQALAGAFLRPEQFASERKYRLRFGVCEGCGGVQIMDKVAPELLFTDYFYRSSQIEAVRRHYEAYARELVRMFEPRRALEIGCNDCALLEPLWRLTPYAIGVDPNTPHDLRTEGLFVRRESFSAQLVADSELDLRDLDLIVANHVFAHVPDINDLTEAVRLALAPSGVFALEVHHLSALLTGTQYDAIYHEHAYYHSLSHLQWHFARFGLQVFHVERVGAHGGSLRCFVDRGERSERASVRAMLDSERAAGIGSIEALVAFANRARAHRDLLASVVRGAGVVAGYGASGRANTLIQWAGLDLDYIVDDSPARQGVFTPGSHIPVCKPDVLNAAPPDHVLALAWTYLDDIKAKCGGRPLIVPFPRPTIVRECFA